MEAKQAVDAFDIDVSLSAIEGSQCPWKAQAALRERGAVVRSTINGDNQAHIITGYDDVVAGLSELRFVKDIGVLTAIHGTTDAAKRAGAVLSTVGSRHLLNTDPPDHTRLRRLVMRSFAPRRIGTLRGRIRELADQFLDELEGQEVADLVGGFAYNLSITMICELLGVPSDQRDDFRRWSVAAMTVPGEDVSAQAQGAAQLHRFLGEHIARRREELAGVAEADASDILSSMILAKDNNDALSDEELVGMAYLILIAGHETTVGLISSMIVGLHRFPDQRALLLERPDLIENAVEEFLRYDGPVQRSTSRIAAEDVVIAGTLIPAGSKVVMQIGGANHDPAFFTEPDRLDITRNTERHVAFGHGIHFCLGAPLARLEAQVAVSALLERFPAYRVVVPDGELAYLPTVVHALSRLPVELKGTPA